MDIDDEAHTHQYESSSAPTRTDLWQQTLQAGKF